MPEIKTFIDSWPEYQLLDSGAFKKLERFGSFFVVRPEPRAWWKPNLSGSEWEQAQIIFDEESGTWSSGGSGKVPKDFDLDYKSVKFKLKLQSGSKHVGVFPEQSAQWAWLDNKIRLSGRSNLKILNLFAYTGASTLVAAAAGASVTHVDASKPSMDWANQNRDVSELADKPVRWILDDCFKFVKREVRRGSKYDGIILDPPAFGRGPQGQVWKIEDDLPELLDNCRELLSDDALFVWLTAYTIDASSLSVANLVRDLVVGRKGVVTAGEMVLQPQTGDKVLPMSICGIWEA
jgi:23S rRNA (cytosine1962-C5)-methyltransferase